jgi:putative ABC transport system permease protein
VSTLDRKMWRGLWQLRGQAFAIALLIACAVGIFVASVSTYQALLRAQAAFYAEQGFADVACLLKKAPDSLRKRLQELPGISVAETRIIAHGTIDMAPFEEPITAWVQSLPDGAASVLNRPMLRVGRAAARHARDEVVVGEAFATAHGLEPGDRFGLVVDGRRTNVRVVGIALSPEHVFSIPPGGTLPDDRHFGLIWMDREAVAAASGMDGAFNQLVVRLAPGADLRVTVAEIDHALEPYGGLGAGGRETSISHRFLSDDIRQLRAVAIVLPLTLMLVATIILHVVITRLVGVEREIIATLSAFGLRPIQIGLHYAKGVALIVATASLLGSLLGGWLAGSMMATYAAICRLPLPVRPREPWVYLAASALALGASLLGVGRAIARAVRVPPAVGMRPEPPAPYSGSLLDRIGATRLLPQVGRMIARQVARRPVRALTGVLSVAAGVAMVVETGFFGDSIDHLLDIEFGRAWRGDLALTFTRPVSSQAVPELERMDDVLEVEPFRSVPVRLRSGPRARSTTLTGYLPDSSLRRIVDLDGRVHPVPLEGISLSRSLAEELGVVEGQTLSVELLEGDRRVRELRVSAVPDRPFGSESFIALDVLQELLGEPGQISGATLRVEGSAKERIYRALRRLPGVATVTSRQATMKAFRGLMLDNVLRFAALMSAFAGAIAFGVLYNIARVSLAERGRELATFRVLGFSHREVSQLVAGELLVHVALAVPLGCLAGLGLSELSAAAMRNEFYRVPVFISPGTYVLAAAVVGLAGAAVILLVRRQVSRLDAVAVLKARV